MHNVSTFPLRCWDALSVNRVGVLGSSHLLQTLQSRVCALLRLIRAKEQVGKKSSGTDRIRVVVGGMQSIPIRYARVSELFLVLCLMEE